MWCKFCSIAIIIIALIVGVLACSPYLDQLQSYLLVIAKFFDVLLPILGVGALLKYLLTCAVCPCCKSGKCGGCGPSKEEGSCGKPDHCETK